MLLGYTKRDDHQFLWPPEVKVVRNINADLRSAPGNDSPIQKKEMYAVKVKESTGKSTNVYRCIQ